MINRKVFAFCQQRVSASGQISPKPIIAAALVHGTQYSQSKAVATPPRTKQNAGYVSMYLCTLSTYITRESGPGSS